MNEKFITDETYEVTLFKRGDMATGQLIPNVRYRRDSDDLFYSLDLVDGDKPNCSRTASELDSILSGYKDYPDHYFTIRLFNHCPETLSNFHQVLLPDGVTLTREHKTASELYWTCNTDPRCSRSSMEVACMIQRVLDSREGDVTMTQILSISDTKEE